MRHPWLLLIPMLAGFAAFGCGKGAAPPDPSKPLSGSAPRSGSQLEGAWFLETDGDFLGLEFEKDQKVRMVPAAAMMVGGVDAVPAMPYRLEGGRLSFALPGAPPGGYELVLSGDFLELRGEMPLAQAKFQRFRRLPAGQTLKQAQEARSKADAQAFRDRVAAVEGYLKRPGLVLVPSNAELMHPVAITIGQSAPNGSFSGKAWHDDRPPHLDLISGQLAHNDRDGKIELKLTFGQRLQPVPSGPAGGAQVVLPITGDREALRIAGSARFGYRGTPVELTLKADPALHAEIVKRFESELSRIEGLKGPLLAALNHYVILEGHSTPLSPSSAGSENLERLVLVGSGPSGLYRGEGTSTNSRTGATEFLTGLVAGVVIANDKPLLQINAPSRQYRLSLSDPGSGKLTGGCFLPGNPQGKPAELTIALALDAARHAERDKEGRAALSALPGSAPYVGLVNTRGAGGSPYLPVILTFASAPGGPVSGTARFLVMETVLNVQGQIADALPGPQLQLHFSDSGKPGGNALFAMNQRSQVWTLSPARSAEGDFRLGVSGAQAGLFELARADQAWIDREKRRLADDLKGGTRFRAAHPERSDLPPTTIDLKIDPATGKVSGTVADGRQLGFVADSTVTGELKDQDGFVLLETRITAPESYKGFRAVYATRMIASPGPQGWLLVASCFPTHQPQARSTFDLVPARDR